MKWDRDILWIIGVELILWALMTAAILYTWDKADSVEQRLKRIEHYFLLDE